MSNAAIVAIVVVVVVVLAIAVFVTTQRRTDARRGAGALSRETVRRDKSALADSAPVPPSGRSVERAAAEARSPSTALATLEARHPAPYVPPDAETVAFTRRQFFNRGMVSLMSVGLGGFGLACIGF